MHLKHNLKCYVHIIQLFVYFICRWEFNCKGLMNKCSLLWVHIAVHCCGLTHKTVHCCGLTHKTVHCCGLTLNPEILWVWLFHLYFLKWLNLYFINKVNTKVLFKVTLCNFFFFLVKYHKCDFVLRTWVC